MSGAVLQVRTPVNVTVKIRGEDKSKEENTPRRSELYCPERANRRHYWLTDLDRASSMSLPADGGERLGMGWANQRTRYSAIVVLNLFTPRIPT